MAVPAAIGVDVGGTKVETALVDAGGRILRSVRADSRYGMDPREWVAQIKTTADALRRQTPDAAVKGIGVGFAGQIDRKTGVVVGSPNVGWRDVPLKAMLEEAMGMRVLLTNDVQAATWAEWKVGAGQGTTHLLCIFVGTGIGGGLVLGGRPYSGAVGSAGELGRTVLDRNGRLCKCGGRGCLEAYAGGWAIATRAQEILWAYPEHGRAMVALAGGDIAAVTAATVSAAAHSGDQLAQELVRQVGEDLGMGVASAVNAFNPEMVVLGGGVVEGLPELGVMVREVVTRQALRSATASLGIIRARLGNQSGVVGAALLALELS